MPIQKHCEHCERAYFVPPARAMKTRFCSMACRNASDRTAERRDLVCENCGDSFNATKDHGVWPKYCSRTCFLAQCVRPEEKECATCGSVFLASKAHHASDDGLRKYCSKQCHAEGLQRGDEYRCLNCDAPFYLAPSTLKQRGKAGCCSNECRTAFYVGARSAEYKGGVYTSAQTGDKYVLMPREDHVGKYIGEHRLVASRAIGRLVTRDEFVIRINRDPADNRPENLFICESNSEFSRRRSGALPWPSASNLYNYKALSLPTAKTKPLPASQA